MSDSVEKDKHQQQILFDELETDLTVDKTLSTQPIIFENQDWQADNKTVSLDEDYDADTASPSWLWRTIFAAFAVLVTIELVDFFTVGFVDRYNGILKISMTNANTSTLDPRRYVYDIVLTSPQGIKTRVIEGVLEVTPGVV